MSGFHEKTTQIVFGDNNSQKTRLALLSTAGLLLIGGVWLWITHQQQQEEGVPLVTHMPATLSGPAPAKPADKPSAPGLTPVTGTAQPGTNQTSANKPQATSPVPAANQASPLANVPPAPQAVTPPQANPVVQPANPALQNAVAITPQAAPTYKPGVKNVPATPHHLAAAEARVGAGKDDPTLGVGPLKTFPRFVDQMAGSSQGQAAAGEDIPPPPPATTTAREPEFVPPPPPPGSGGEVPPGGPDMGLAVAELPAPPPKPSIANKMKLVAVIGDRAVLAFTDTKSRMENKWPRMITLGPGDQFESVSVVNVNADSVTLDEDGDRSVKSMDPVK